MKLVFDYYIVYITVNETVGKPDQISSNNWMIVNWMYKKTAALLSQDCLRKTMNIPSQDNWCPSAETRTEHLRNTNVTAWANLVYTCIYTDYTERVGLKAHALCACRYVHAFIWRKNSLPVLRLLWTDLLYDFGRMLKALQRFSKHWEQENLVAKTCFTGSFQVCLNSTTFSITSLHWSRGDSLLDSIPLKFCPITGPSPTNS
jgi:hypothetical protein